MSSQPNFNAYFYTAHEHSLMGSTVKQRHYAEPHKPIGVIDNIFDIEECNNLRNKNPILKVFVCYWGIKGQIGTAKISALDSVSLSPNYGRTLHDPVLVGTDEADYYKDHRKDFPFLRQEPQTELEKQGESAK